MLIYIYILFFKRQIINLSDETLKNNANSFLKWNLLSGAILQGVDELIRASARRMHARIEG